MVIKKRNRKFLIISLAILIALVVLTVVYFSIFYFKNCQNKVCFNDNLKDCKRAKIVVSGNMSFEYKILGKEKNSCNVNVKLLRGDLTNQDSLTLESKEMICSLPLGTIAVPESDLSLCHGLLKEGLQDLIIQKLHTYIVQNLEKINEVI